MWININGEQYVRLEDVVEAITNALDALAPKQKSKETKEVKQVDGQLPLLEVPVFPVSNNWEPRNHKRLPQAEYLAERERVYRAVMSFVECGVSPTRKQVALIAATNYDVARIHIRALMAAGRISKDNISSRGTK